MEELANKFDRKAKLREAWLTDNCKLLTADNFGADLPAVDASVKKHEAIETDIKVMIISSLKVFFNDLLLFDFVIYFYGGYDIKEKCI